MESESVRKNYRRFAEVEARGVSETYLVLANGIADDDLLPEKIAALPAIKRQPNLLFAAARHCGAPIDTFAAFKYWTLEHWPSIVQIMLARSTQTNEAARCAVLLPVLSRLEGPLSLIEVGASAGLCLYPDRYSYAYSTMDQTAHLHPAAGASSVTLPCQLRAGTTPERVPEVRWRAGLDLNPLDVSNPEELGWLETLVWPEHTERRHRLHEAAKIVMQDPPRIDRGDLTDGLDTLIAEAPRESRVVVFHSAVLAYVGREEREAFSRQMSAREDLTWVSNEGAGVLPSLTSRIDRPVDGHHILAVDGVPVALTGPHGQSYEEL